MSESPICYIEIPTPNMGKAINFYVSIFGWQVQKSELSDVEYAMFSVDGVGVNGGFSSLLPVTDGGVLLYIKVDDIPLALENIKKAGGDIVKEKEPIGGEFGFSAGFKDPNGNQMGLWSKD